VSAFEKQMRLKAHYVIRPKHLWASIRDHPPAEHSRLSVLPSAAAPPQRSQLLAALSVGCEIIRLRNICHRLDLGAGLDEALEALAGGNSEAAVAKLANLDDALTVRSGTAILRARAGLLAISEALAEHAAYFDAVAPR